MQFSLHFTSVERVWVYHFMKEVIAGNAVDPTANEKEKPLHNKTDKTKDRIRSKKGKCQLGFLTF